MDDKLYIYIYIIARLPKVNTKLSTSYTQRMEITREERETGKVSSKRVASIDESNDASVPIDDENKCK